ncbi:sensor domain-containing protein [Thiospirochaeta perfilievii]|uniref:sensor domain-containing protein n=1 Tax=Thiospirochaeta perfilievii TaxID=252967 RepID=UPI001659B493|nr:bifunctional diguanylate cyclase/phosphodiesterase [Thiospirochaeta perfilievii]
MKFTKVDRRFIDLLLNSTSEGVFILDHHKSLVYSNKRYLEITGNISNNITGKIPTSVSSGWHDNGFYKRMWEIIDVNGFWEDEVWDTNKLDNSLYVMNQKLLKYRDGFKTKYLGIISDVTAKLQTLQELHYLERIDQSTNVANRFFGEKKLNEFIKEKRENIAVIYLDVNNFSLIPETFGHKQGDSVLKEIAFRLIDCIKSENIFSFGLDRFVLYFTYVNSEDIESRAFEIIDSFYEPFNVKGNDFFLSVNLGIALYNSDGETSEELIRNADSAMQESRKEEFNTFCFYESNMNESVVEQFQLISDLRKSIERRELKMVYQPQVDILKNKTVGAEALIRWENRDRGFVSPTRFIPIAEKKGLMTPIGEWVLRNSCNQLENWKENNLRETTMAINISGVQFNDKRLLPLIRNIFYNKVDTSLIELEITESAFVDDIDLSIKTMYGLKDMGFKLAIDDFGTGFSSLSYLKRFPIDKLKIDKSFIENILDEQGNIAIVKSILNLAQNLDLKVIAEGVETVEQRDFIKNLGCPLIQGFYYSRPLDAKEFILFHNDKINK